MRKLPIDQLAAGQCVARAVLTPGGTALVQPGTALSPAVIHRLGGLGITEVWIDESPEDGSGVATLEDRLEALERRFSAHQGNALMQDLKTVIARQLRQEYDADAGDR